MKTTRSQILGTLVGGAVGDAMGAPFEGLWSQDIPEHAAFVSGYHQYHGYPLGQYTDDTQLTLATIESIVRNGDIVLSDIAYSIAELWRHQSVIGPGGACTQAAERFLASGDYESMGASVGQAGNGTAMRTAALGLWFGNDHDQLVAQVADVSRLTHQDPRSVAGGVAIALAINLLAVDSQFEPKSFCAALADAIAPICQPFSALLRQLPDYRGGKETMRWIANAGQASEEFSEPIISPFVVPTVLAAIHAIIQHPTSWCACSLSIF